jgi:hypothetical protein
MVLFDIDPSYEVVLGGWLVACLSWISRAEGMAPHPGVNFDLLKARHSEKKSPMVSGLERQSGHDSRLISEVDLHSMN